MKDNLKIPKKPIQGSNSNSAQSKHKSAPYPHFRYYKKSEHPALIVGERPIEEYEYRKVMHSSKEGGRNNEKIVPNPNPKDPRPMYIAKRKRHDKKITFENEPLPWKYPIIGHKKK